MTTNSQAMNQKISNITSTYMLRSFKNIISGKMNGPNLMNSAAHQGHQEYLIDNRDNEELR